MNLTQPEDPVQIIDEEGNEDIEDKGDGTLTVDSTGVLIIHHSSFHDGWIILNFVYTSTPWLT